MKSYKEWEQALGSGFSPFTRTVLWDVYCNARDNYLFPPVTASASTQRVLYNVVPAQA